MLPARVLDSYCSFQMSLISYTDEVFMAKKLAKNNIASGAPVQ